MRRRAPRPVELSIVSLADRLQPATRLGAIQRIWTATVGDVVAAQAQPVAERDGVVTVSCRSAVWAQELDLMGPELVARLNADLGEVAVGRLRCVATPPAR